MRSDVIPPAPHPADVRPLDYERVADAIRFIRNRAPHQPSLTEVAAHVYLAPEHFQRTFTRWAGLSPKQFARTLTLEYARRLLAEPDAERSLFDVADAAGYSSPSRLHDAFVRLEAMTPGEWRSRDTRIGWAFAKTRFGRALVAATDRGICSLSFVAADDSDGEEAVAVLRQRYPHAVLAEAPLGDLQRRALAVVDGAAADPATPLALHVRGTPFQVQVWRALLGAAPSGGATTYARLAARVGKPTGARAVGAAVGANRVAWLIPCHRVLRATGELSGYAWGVERKAAMLGVEVSGG